MKLSISFNVAVFYETFIFTNQQKLHPFAESFLRKKSKSTKTNMKSATLRIFYSLYINGL